MTETSLRPARRFLVAVPAYNEEMNLSSLLDRFELLNSALEIRGIQLRVMVVDDASTDGTALAVQSYLTKMKPGWLEFVQHPENRNLAGVLETGFAWAAKNLVDGDIGFGLLDGDDSHPPMQFCAMIQRLLEGYDVAIASRFQHQAIVRGVTRFRRFLSFGMSVLFRSLGRIENVRDYSCGFRAYSVGIVRAVTPLKLKYRSFACMVEVLCRCDRKGAIICEVPFVLRYDLKRGESKMRFARTITETLKVLFDRNL